MDVNAINTNNISPLNNNVPSQQVDKNNSTSAIQGNDEFINLSIAEYNTKRDELSASLQAFNEGIGIAKTAQNGINRQEEYLNNIQDKLKSVASEESQVQDNNSIKNDINGELLKFREEAFQTTYKGESLLSVDEYDDSTSIDISTKEAYFSTDKPNTPEIATEIAQQVSSSDLNNTDALQATINVVENSVNQLQNLKDQFTDLGNKLESSARVSIQEQVDLSNQNRANKDINFGKEATDFTKTNVQANAGYLAASQANIVQEQTVRLVGVR